MSVHDPRPAAWEFLRGFLENWDAAIYTMPEFLPPDFAHSSA